MAQFTTLYSGSSGNCAWVEEDGKYILIDMGKSSRITLSALQSLGCDVGGLCGIFVTHEHSDHVKGLDVFLRHYSVPVYGMAATLDYMATNGIVPACANLTDMDGRTEELDGFTVSAFTTSHDSVACCGYSVITPQGKRVCIATDLGYVSDEVMANLYGADAVGLECNYDRYMLMSGRYPGYLKARIDSNRGHLCNDESAVAVTKLIDAGCKNIALCHISAENNTPELALRAVQASLLSRGVQPQADVRVQASARHEVSPVFVL